MISNRTIQLFGRKILSFALFFLAAAIISILGSACNCCAGESGKLPEITQDNFGGYLLVYFREHDHDIFFALSRDGYDFTDVNGGKCVMKGLDLAEQKGIRDPHIYRGPDAFYMTLTDLHIYAKQEGLRDTDWQRDGSRYGCGFNVFTPVDKAGGNALQAIIVNYYTI